MSMSEKITVFAICMRVDHVAAGSCRVSVSKTTYVEMKRLGIFFCAFQEPTKQPLVRARTLSVVSTATLRHWMSGSPQGCFCFCFCSAPASCWLLRIPKVRIVGLRVGTCRTDLLSRFSSQHATKKTLWKDTSIFEADFGFLRIYLEIFGAQPRTARHQCLAIKNGMGWKRTERWL